MRKHAFWEAQIPGLYILNYDAEQHSCRIKLAKFVVFTLRLLLTQDFEDAKELICLDVRGDF